MGVRVYFLEFFACFNHNIQNLDIPVITQTFLTFAVARNGLNIPMPSVWIEDEAMKKLQCDLMHMLHLGCTKSSFGMENNGSFSMC